MWLIGYMRQRATTSLVVFINAFYSNSNFKSLTNLNPKINIFFVKYMEGKFWTI